MKTWHFVSMAVIAAGTLLYVQERRQRSAAEQTHAEIKALSAALGELRGKGSNTTVQRVIERRVQLVEPPAQDAPASEAPASEGRAPDGDERGPSTKRQAGRTTEEVVAYSESAFRKESIDRAWAQPSEGRIAEKMRTVLKDPAQIRSVECRESFCRMEALVEEDASSRGFLEQMLDNDVWTGPVSVFPTISADGKVTVTAYLAREGRSLPTPPRSL